jgi:hypothetical protein
MKRVRKGATHRSSPSGTILLALLIFLGDSLSVHAQADPVVEISAPANGEVLTGVVEIRGSLASSTFRSGGLAFAYAGQVQGPWFIIAEFTEPSSAAFLAFWDTPALTDGAYTLRLRLNGTDGTVRDALISVQVRNYTTAPTPTASVTPTQLPALLIATPVLVPATPTAKRPVPLTPTALPPNPASLTDSDLLIGFARGGLAILSVVLLWGAITLRRRV